MDQEFENLIKERYAILPEDIKTAIKSLPLMAIMQEIASQNSLHIDQAGDLYNETLLVLLGVEGVGRFEKNLRDHLNIESSVSTRIAATINTRVFLTVRQSLRLLQEAQEKLEAAQTEIPAPDSRESILAEIENPTLSRQSASVTGSETANAVAHDFIASKLTQTVNLPAQQANIALKAPAAPTPTEQTKPQTYAADPYRESIN